MTTPQTLPHDLDAERATLGSVLLDRDAVLPIAPFLTPAMFYQARNGTIFQAMLTCADRREPSDLVTVVAELRRLGQLEAVGDISYLIDLSNSVPTSAHVEYYARTVWTTAKRRALLQASARIAGYAMDEAADLDASLSAASEDILTVGGDSAEKGFLSFAQIADEVWGRLQQIQEGGQSLVGVPSGFKDYDRMTGGLQKSDLIILAARPAVGKTSLALNIAQHAAMIEGASVAIFSLEMSRDQLFQRMISSHTGVDMQKLRNGQISHENLEIVAKAVGELSSLPIYIDDAPGVSIAHVRAKARQLQATKGVDLIIIDYLQLMTGSFKKDPNRVQEVSEISRGCKTLAKEMDVPVIALSQLSRAVESRTSHVPMLSDLRESGSLEQDADQVLFIYREELYDPDTDKKGIAELHIAKHRNGPTGIVPLRFFRSTTRFANLETYRQPDGY